MAETDLGHHRVTREIISVFFEVYNKLGFGYLESIYSRGLERKLRARGFEVAREYGVQVLLDGEEVGFHRLDLVVDRSVVVEIKSTPRLHPVARRQLYNYLRATSLEVGLLLHFGPEPKFQRVFVPTLRPSTFPVAPSDPSDALVRSDITR